MADPADLDAERRDLVDSARRDGLDRRPFAPGSGKRPDAVPLANGMMRISYGAFFFDMTPNGLIAVHQDDWLSKYALAIDGTTDVEGKFARFTPAGPAAIADDNIIQTGELLVFLPAYRAHAALASAVDPTADPAEEANARKRAAMRAPGFIDETIENLPDRNIVEAGKKTVMGLIDATLQDWLRKTLPGVDELTESDKQAIFVTSSELTVAVLLYEFFSGTGPAERKFDETHAIVQYIENSRISDAIVEAFKDRNKISNPVSTLNPLRGSYQFSPDGGDLFDSITKHVDAIEKFSDGDPVLGFLGGVSYIAKPNLDGSELAVTIIDDKSLNSYVVHSVASVPREKPPPFTIVSPEESTISLVPATPYTTTRQTYEFVLPVP